MKRNATVIVFLVLIAALSLFFLLRKTPQTQNSRAAAGGPLVYLDTTITSVKKGETFEITLTINAGDKKPTAVDFRLQFDKGQLKATAVKPSSRFSVDLPVGEEKIGADYVHAIVGSTPTGLSSGVLPVATISFTALENDPGCITIHPDTAATAVGETGNIIKERQDFCFGQKKKSLIQEETKKPTQTSQSMPTCKDADINNDNSNNTIDVSAVMFAYGSGNSHIGIADTSVVGKNDINKDGVVNAQDLSFSIGCLSGI